MTLPITVIIPCHNQAGTLERAVKSALEAKAQRVFIFDDASDGDDVYRIGMRLEQKRLNVWYMSSGDARFGVCAARNHMVALCHTTLIVPLDADDVLLPGGLEALHAAWKPGVWVYGGWREQGFNYQAPPPGMLDRKDVAWVTMLYSKDDWRKAGGYDPDFSIGNEVWAFQLALQAAGVKAVRVPEIIFERTTGGERMAKAQRFKTLINDMMREKYGAKTIR